MVFILAFQLAFVALFMRILLLSFNLKRRQNLSFQATFTLIEIGLFLMVGICFILSSAFQINNHPNFPIVVIIYSICYLGLWIHKIDFKYTIFFHGLFLTATSLLCWISLLLALKFYTYFQYMSIPLIGVLLFTPLFMSILSLSQLRYQCSLNKQYKLSQTLLMGGFILILIDFSVGILTQGQIEFLAYFNPNI